MRRFLFPIFCILFLAFSPGLAEDSASTQNELMKSYQREMLFLSTYKKELMDKLQSIDVHRRQSLREGEKQLLDLERQWLGLQTQNEILLQRLSDIERDVDFKNENKESLQTVLQQAQIDMPKGAVDDSQPLDQKMDVLFTHSLKLLQESGKPKVEEGEFFAKNGEQIKGQVVSLGSVARFGVHEKKVAALFPTGGGAFRVWSWLDQKALDLTNGFFPGTLSFFLYQDADKEFVVEAEKSWLQVVQSGGAIAWVIVFLGALAFILSLLRYLLLRNSRLKNAEEMEEMIGKMESGDISELRDYCLQNSNSVTRVIGRTLSQLKNNSEKVEDVIAEGIVMESQLIDRFGVIILVIASVAPLLGLLGTVTGMISTFDIITLHGTGNPKLLSGGISEALVTTMLGLIVAIPTLFIGQFLSSVNESIKSDMEKWALTLCNRFHGNTQL